MLYTLRFFSSKCSLFHNANLFGSCIIHILYTECAKLKKNNSGAKGLMLGNGLFTGECLDSFVYGLCCKFREGNLLYLLWRSLTRNTTTSTHARAVEYTFFWFYCRNSELHSFHSLFARFFKMQKVYFVKCFKGNQRTFGKGFN